MEHKNHDSHDSHSHGHHPLVPIRVYVNTLLALVVLTVLTVGASYLDFGQFNIVVNLGIACVKAALVMSFFMGLKYDNMLNRTYILSSFACIAILISITASDLWTRPKPDPVAVKQAASSLTAADLPKLLAGSPDLVAKGKGVYDTNCAVCHGAGGNGDGVGGAALNPKPRNFHAAGDTWTHGNSAKSIYYTLAVGSPGTGMAGYKSLSPEDRWALVHYVMSFAPEAQRVGKADAKFDQVVKEDLGEGGAGGAPKAALPIDFAIDRMTTAH